jgi:hypothetical protein
VKGVAIVAFGFADDRQLEISHARIVF